MSEQANSGETTKTSNPARSAILYVLLGLMVVALIYDYRVARPAVSADYDKVAEASMEANRVANDFLTNTEVRELLGKEPTETFDDGPETVEVYHYTGGLIIKPHKLYTVYRKSGDELMFSRHSKFAYDESQSVGPTESVIITAEDSASEDAIYDSEEGGGTPAASSGDSGSGPQSSSAGSDSGSSGSVGGGDSGSSTPPGAEPPDLSALEAEADEAEAKDE
ncbi:hypothetical protein [Roseiconus lacunae]|uniref:DUF4845 domain-containing protein n=1 Tax=Roseiconus lacunae TaxID=2605694 RepID=A0ABT7PH29_9BACT|nr:hypothetical protein [Roseiconus lacunae]MDM4015790.1 hypothetical protein [Roseiconus lacunae]